MMRTPAPDARPFAHPQHAAHARWALLTLALLAFGCDSESSTPNAQDMSQPDAAADMTAADQSQAQDQNMAADLSQDQSITQDAQPDEAIDLSPLGGDRPAQVALPDDYTSAKSWPLVVLLHGFRASGRAQDAYMGISRRRTKDGFVLVMPNGTTDLSDRRFWNADEACCNFDKLDIDDVGYLRGVIEEAKTRYNIDAGRVYLLGHSNGGFMSYRMACEAADQITAIASLAGAARSNPDLCSPSEPVSILQIHGTKDDTILYEGSANGITGTGYPSAQETIDRWLMRNGCQGGPVGGDAKDLDKLLEGDETTTVQWQNCARDTEVALWTIQDGLHLPSYTEDFATETLAWLMRHKKP